MKKILFRHCILMMLIFTCKSNHAQPILLTNLISPAPIEQAGNAIDIHLAFLNNSGGALTSATFNYSVNGGTTNNSPWTGNLGTGNSDTVILPPFVIPSGQYSLCIWTTSPASDTICYTYVGSNSIITAPYADDFENPSAWASSLSIPNYQSGWQLGTPNYGYVNTPHSGVKSWVIGLDSGYEKGMLSYLYSPYFNFSNSNNWTISFWQNRFTQPTLDGAWLEYTLDSGLTWIVMGTINDTNALNWYKDSIYYYGNYQVAWDSESNGWWQSTYNWQLGAWSVVQMRFAFYSDPSGGVEDGIAIDDFSIDSCNLSVSMATTTNVSCFGGNDGMLCANVMGGTAPYSYIWSNGATTQCVSNLLAGTYTVIVSDVNFCTASVVATITEPPPLTITTSSNVTICQGTDLCVAATGGTSPYSYLWSTGSTTACLVTPSPGTYSVTITDANACSVNGIFILTVAPLPIIDWGFANTIYCTGMPPQNLCPNYLSGTPPYAYQWSTGEATACATIVLQGNFTIVVTDANGCTASSLYAVSPNGGLFVSAGTDTLAGCGLCNGAVTVTVNGMPPPYTFGWYPPAGINQGGTPFNYSGFCADSIYAVEVWDASLGAHGCTTVQLTDTCNYYPFPVNDAQWSVEFGYYGLPGQVCTDTWHYGISGDTIISSNTYQKIYLSNCDSTFNLGCANYFTAIREDASHKIYMRWQNETSDRVLYDFNLNVGDSFYFDLPTFPFQQMYKPVINVDSILVNGSYRKRISFYGATAVQEDWIEGIGNTAGLFETNDFIGNLYYNLRCMSDNGTQLIGTPGNCYCNDSSSAFADYVWPGDANYDGVANNLDLLPIGIGYGSSGPIRPGASLVWAAQAAPDWNDSLASNVNYKHIDCNGDGTINDADTLAIIQNYGETHPLRLLSPSQNLLDPYLYFDIVVDTVGTSQQLDVPLMFGTSLVPADSIYGLAFTVNYDTALVKADSVGISFSPSWIGTTGTDMITLNHNDALNGKLHVGITRIDHNNVSGFGQIAKVTVVTVDNVSGKIAATSVFDTLTFILSDVTIIDKDENVRNVNLGNDTLIVEDSTTSIYEILASEKIKVYPNPAKDKLFVVFPYQLLVNEISISNVIGEKMEKESVFNNNVMEIRNLKKYSNGIYFLKIKTDKGTVVKKFSVMN